MGKAGTDIDVETEIRAIGYMIDSLRERVVDESVEAALGCARICLDDALLRGGGMPVPQASHEPE